MAVQPQTPYIEYVANGVATTFNLGFECSNSDFLIVKKDGAVVEDSTWQLVNNSVVFNEPPSVSTKLIFERDSKIERSTNFQTAYNSFRPAPLNNNFDYIVYILQEISARLIREISGRKLSDTELTQYVKDYVESVLSINNPEAITLVVADIVQTTIDGDIQTQQEFNEYLLNYINVKYPSVAGFLDEVETSFNNFTTTNQNLINTTVAQAQTDVSTAVATIQPAITQAIGTVGGQIQVADLATLNTITPSVTNQGAMLDNGDIYRWKATPLPAAWVFTGVNYLNGAITYVKERIEEVNSSNYAHAAIDDSGKIAFGIKKDGTTEAASLEAKSLSSQQANLKAVTTSLLSISDSEVGVSQSSDLVYAIADVSGNVAFSVDKAGIVVIPQLKQKNSTFKTLKIGNDDSIMHIGDSMTASHYCLQNKSYISLLSQISPFRHINYGVSGEEAIDMQNRILNDTSVFSSSLKDSKPKYLFITTYTNDGASRADLKYFEENIRRLIDVSLAFGVKPVIVGYWNLAQSADHQSLKAIADEYKIPAIWCDVINKQVGTYASTPVLFNELHTGTRTNGLWWIPMFDFINLINPVRTIKIFRKRPSFTASTDAMLLYKDVIDKSIKWQEIGVGHYSFSDAKAIKFDEIDTLAAADKTWALRDDEYVKLQNNSAITISDYMLVEFTLDAYPQNLTSIQLNLDLIGTFEVSVRDFHNVSTAVARPPNISDTTYLSVWDKPRGAWRALTLASGKVTIEKADMIRSMVGNKVSVLIKGTGSIKGLSVDYTSEKYESLPSYPQKLNEKLGNELLAQPLVGTTAQLADWVKTGTVNTLIPIDSPKIPRKPDQDIPVDGVCILTTTNSIQQSVTFAAKEDMRTFKVVVWGRYFPKAFLDRTIAAYSGLDASQIVDRSVGGNVSDITKDSFDMKRIQLITWGGATQPSYIGAYQVGSTGLFYRPVVFYVEVQPYETQLSIKLSALDTDVQLAKISVKEVI